MSPPRGVRERSYCIEGPSSVTKIWTRKKRVDVEAAASVGPELLAESASRSRDSFPMTSYQAACAGQTPHDAAPRRSLVRLADRRARCVVDLGVCKTPSHLCAAPLWRGAGVVFS